jgi:peroxiredoxin Q/BCP
MRIIAVAVFVILFMFAWSLTFAALLKDGDKAPDFTLKDQNGKTVTLSQYAGKSNVILYFYPKDFTKGCTAEACSFRDNYEVFQKKGAVVIGVSFDNDTSHVKFAQAYHLPFSLISDTKGVLGKEYGVSSKMGFSDRVTFVINKKGVIKYVYESLKDATLHVENALKDLEKL